MIVRFLEMAMLKKTLSGTRAIFTALKANGRIAAPSQNGVCLCYKNFSSLGSPPAHFKWHKLPIISSYIPVNFTKSGGRGSSLLRFISVGSQLKKPANAQGIQKHISPLTTKRPVRKKIGKGQVQSEDCFRVTAYATAEEIHLESLKIDLQTQGLYDVKALPSDLISSLYVCAKYPVEDEPREFFINREGSVVFWNIPDVEKQEILKFIQKHQDDSYSSALVRTECEEMDYTYTESATNLSGDDIQLCKKQRPVENEEDAKVVGEQLHLEKYAFSNALSLSVKLSIWEASLSHYVDSIEWVTDDLKKGDEIKMSRSDVLKKTGELFTLRHLINLSSDLLDTPDFYWDRPQIENLYLKTCSYLNIPRRTRVMNEKLNYCCELAELLRTHLNDQHHTRLEWMIIILILVEVVFETVHMIERHV